MLQVTNLQVNLSEDDTQILKGVSLDVSPGQVHVLNGRNGSGKSTLVNTIMGNPAFEITSGNIHIVDETYPEHIVEELKPTDVDESEYIIQPGSKKGTYTIDITEAEPNERSLAGVFLATQYPVEIPGVNLMQYLRLIYNARRPEGEKLPVFKFRQLIKEKAAIINYPEHLLSRNLNEGFSGGEKKKTEILQMLVVEPRYVLLDEIDSGLDKESVKEVFGGLQHIHELYPNMSFVIITHYDRAQEYLQPDFVHTMKDGELIKG